MIPTAKMIGSIAVCALVSFFAWRQDARAGEYDVSPSWKGAYAGLQGGVMWNDVSFSRLVSLNYKSGKAGGFAGFNLPVMGLVAGLEADVNRGTLQHEFDAIVETSGQPGTSVTARSDRSYNGSVRARLGIPIGRALLYATGGYSWSHMKTTVPIPNGLTFNSTMLLSGPVYGGGIEYKLFDAATVRIEALHYDFGSAGIADQGSTASIATIEASSTVVRGGVVFQFN